MDDVGTLALSCADTAQEGDKKMSTCSEQEWVVVWSANDDPCIHHEVNPGSGVNIGDGIIRHGDYVCVSAYAEYTCTHCEPSRSQPLTRGVV